MLTVFASHAKYNNNNNNNNGNPTHLTWRRTTSKTSSKRFVVFWSFFLWKSSPWHAASNSIATTILSNKHNHRSIIKYVCMYWYVCIWIYKYILIKSDIHYSYELTIDFQLFDSNSERIRCHLSGLACASPKTKHVLSLKKDQTNDI